MQFKISDFFFTNWFQITVDFRFVQDQDTRIDFIRLMLEANRHAETGSVVAPDDETYTKSLSGATVSEPRRIQPMSIEVKT